MSGLNMTLNNVRVINPILTEVVQGFADVSYVGSNLFPRVATIARGGQIIQFGKEAFKLYNTARAPGADTKRLEFGYSGTPFFLENHAVETLVPREWLQDAAAVPHIDLAQKAILTDMRVLLRELEVEQAALALNTSNYAAGNQFAAGSSDKWSNGSSTPIAQIEAARETIRSSVGMYPNTMVISAKAFAALKTHPTIVDRFKYTMHGTLTPDLIGDVLEIPNLVVGKGVYSDDAGNFGDIWGTGAVLAYVPDTISTMEQPSYGYTYTLDGNPLVEEPYWDNG